jgi:DNA-directed RNA polymerase specialized sigma24 family protein
LIRHTRLFAYIHSLVRDLNDTDDLFQQVALILWKKSAAFASQRLTGSNCCRWTRIACCTPSV